MTTWLDLEMQGPKPMAKPTILNQLQLIIDRDTKALKKLRRLKKKGLFRRIIYARRYHGVDKIPLKELKVKIQRYVEEDHCYQ
tara:strand:- start:21906 stop:22154 length:249 start_codon:yes stop_codon:yes gene_type:complete